MMSHAAHFVTLPDVPRLTLANLTAPSCLVGAPGSLSPLDLTIEGGRSVPGEIGERVDMKGAMVFPAFIDARSWMELFARPQSDRTCFAAAAPSNGPSPTTPSSTT